nr:glycoside hydrolase family 97 catalytic domain-containing protein [Streptomyces regalis]
MDLPSVISYATSKGIVDFLHVNRLALTDADSLFGLYKSWGAAGIKLGFINDGTQTMTDRITDWAKAAAKYRLLIDMHDDVGDRLRRRHPRHQPVPDPGRGQHPDRHL